MNAGTLLQREARLRTAIRFTLSRSNIYPPDTVC